MAGVCVMGGGPAGSVFAMRMAALGHQVDLIETARFPRPHLGESLSPGVLPLLRSFKAGDALDGAQPVHQVEVAWDGQAQIRADERAEGRLVDRGSFDARLLHHAQRLGVRLHHPARIIARDHDEQGWRIVVEMETGRRTLTADFLADARGRAGAGAWRREMTGPATLALHAYWRGPSLPSHPVIQAGDDAWYWAVPLPDGSCNLQVFVDARHFAAAPKTTLAARYLSLLPSGLARGECASEVLASDATPSLAQAAAGTSGLALGEAALALDPLSSSGVQKAIQTSLAAAVVANTLIRRPASADAATAFYQSSLEEASARHRSWAKGYYAGAARTRPANFWQARAAGSRDDAAQPLVTAADEASIVGEPVELSRDLIVADAPCIEGDFVTLRQALRHPRLDGAVAYLGGEPLAPLVGDLRGGATLVEIAQGWSRRMPFTSALSIAIWLRNSGILVASGEARP